MDLLELTTIRGTNLAFLNPKKYDKHPCPFYTEVPPEGGVVPKEITNCLTILKRGVVGSDGVGGPVKKGDPFNRTTSVKKTQKFVHIVFNSYLNKYLQE